MKSLKEYSFDEMLNILNDVQIPEEFFNEILKNIRTKINSEENVISLFSSEIFSKDSMNYHEKSFEKINDIVYESKFFTINVMNLLKGNKYGCGNDIKKEYDEYLSTLKENFPYLEKFKKITFTNRLSKVINFHKFVDSIGEKTITIFFSEGNQIVNTIYDYLSNIEIMTEDLTITNLPRVIVSKMDDAPICSMYINPKKPDEFIFDLPNIDKVLF